MIPANLIVSKYTQGNEFIRTDDYKDYQGYYYEFNGKAFTGKKYSLDSIEIIRKNSDQVNPLLSNPSTFNYGAISGVNIPSNPPIASLSNKSNSPNFDTLTRFFYKKYNDNIIKETNENSYKSLQTNPIYQTAFIGTYQGRTQTIDEANQQIPGIKSFLYYSNAYDE